MKAVLKMALTKPRFGRHLEPLSQYDRDKVKIRFSHSPNDRRPVHVGRNIETLPSISPEKFSQTELKDLPRRNLQKLSPSLIYKTSWPTAKLSFGGFASNDRLRCSNESRTINCPDSPDRDLKSILAGSKGKQTPQNRKILPELRREKRVSFSLPSSLLVDDRHYEIGADPSHGSNRKAILPSLPARKYQFTKQYRDPKMIQMLTTQEPVVCHYHKADKHARCLDHKNARTMAPRNSFSNASQKHHSLAQKIQARRSRGYATKPLIDPVLRPVGAKASPVKHGSQLPLSILEKARLVLLEKMQSATISHSRPIASRRVVFLPSLAAPCSEEFAIAMRRAHGKRFVSSPAVIEHVRQGSIPLQATASLLDAILRPPSTPTVT